MRAYYDCEFLENGKTIELISIGIVRADGKEYYAVNAEMPWVQVTQHDWLSENVVPHLPTIYGDYQLNHLDPSVMPRNVISAGVEAFLLEAFEVDGTLELWSWYSAYDHVALCQLWGPMIDRPSFVPMYTNDIQQEFQRFGNPAVPGHLTQDDMPNAHNALADAKYHKRLHEFIKKVGQEQYREAVLEALHPELGYWCDLDNLHKEKN